jgi:hypothetical protein
MIFLAERTQRASKATIATESNEERAGPGVRT